MPHPVLGGGGVYPRVSPFRPGMGIPHQLDGVPPTWTWDGVPPPIQTLDGVTPLSAEWSIPPVQTWDGIPPPESAGWGPPCLYLAWGTPLPRRGVDWQTNWKQCIPPILRMRAVITVFVHFFSVLTVCAAGHYRSEGACALCTDNKIKMTSGDAPNCDDNDPCDGVTTTPNSEHTACGKWKEILFLLSELSVQAK